MKEYKAKINLLIPALVITSVLNNGCSLLRNQERTKELVAVNHIVHMGQSLGAGEQSLPIITDMVTGFGNLRFSMGTHTWTQNNYPDKPALRKTKIFSFVPLNAVQRGGEGETIANGMCDHLTQSIANLHSKQFRFLFSYAGQGGRYLRELNKHHDDAKDTRAGTRRSGGGYYQTSIDDVKRAKRISDSLKLNYAVFGITWMQGEANGAGRMNRWDSVLPLQEARAVYKDDLVQLKNDYQHDIKAITGQKEKIPFFTYQTAGNMAGIAQLQATDQEQDMFMIGPTYMLPNAENSYYYSGNKLVHGDGIHLTADGERWLGEQFGKVMRKVIVEGMDWQPLRPLKAWRNENRKSVFVRFHVPDPPIVIDTSFLPRQDKGLGFEIYDEKNNRYDIQKVDITANDELKISLVNDLPAGISLFVRYGFQTKVTDIFPPVKSINAPVTGKDGHESVEILFDGNILDDIAILNKEGVFYLNNITVDNKDLTSLIVRETYLDTQGNTVFRGELEDLKNNINFQPGQKCYTGRRFAYGNIRDDDQEKSTFSFKDKTYGSRHGQSYPLYNWCITFEDLEISSDPE